MDTPRTMEVDGEMEDEWEDGDDAEEMDDTREICSICGVRIYSWMEDAHARYHQLPS
jgi:hypothetical protein